MTSTPQADTPRPYRSARRAQQAAETRARVVAAATRLFSERGWSATGMRDVAKEADVAVETVYANFRAKSELLLAAIDVGVVGDDEAVPLSQRPEFVALGEGELPDRVDAAVRLLSAINQRSWRLRRAINEGAASEPQLAAKVRELELRRRDNIRQGAELVAGRPVSDTELDALWVVMGAEVFALLTEIGDRTVPDYERWLARTITALLAGG